MYKFFFLLLLTWSCSVPKCNPQKPEIIQTIEGSNNGDISYFHELLVPGISRKCDSATVMATIKTYVQEQNQYIPVRGVRLFQSKEHFDRGETLSQPKSYYRDCVAEVYINRQTGAPEEFAFYNNSGEVSYRGARWNPY
jgi:hypothetical protein